jgi:hypothetical protein
MDQIIVDGTFASSFWQRYQNISCYNHNSLICWVISCITWQHGKKMKVNLYIGYSPVEYGVIWIAHWHVCVRNGGCILRTSSCFTLCNIAYCDAIRAIVYWRIQKSDFESGLFVRSIAQTLDNATKNQIVVWPGPFTSILYQKHPVLTFCNL